HPLWMGINAIPKPRNPASAAEAPARAECAADLARNAYLQDDYNAFWMERNYVKDVANATAPMLYAHGFLDENTPMSLVPDFYNAYPGVKRMWLQQHGHGVPGSFEAYHLHVHRWLDHFMLGLDNGALDLPPVVLQDNRGKYHALPEWPLRDAPSLTLHLGPGSLAPERPDEGRLSWRDGSLEEVRGAHVPQPGTYLRFTSEPLPEDVHVSGAPRVTLVVSSTARDTQLDVLLYAMDEKGTLTFVTRGYQDARHRESLAEGRDVTPGEEATYAFVLHARDHHLPAGTRLVLDLTSVDKYVVPDAPGATNTLVLGESRIELPVLDLARTTFLDEAPRVA
ncbi:MAG TPA: CocE/NonD family hydrolase C-terminal non-catalytic domain-containing protein, partial [Candidatus Thermoplasmatota archaeon]|nr:CocE/NonD family hydrolase C-terminal non-catalytic domain-containing protein [Candidatus Thermoplasmatota archaeon]